MRGNDGTVCPLVKVKSWRVDQGADKTSRPEHVLVLDPTARTRQRAAMFPIRDHNPSTRTPFVTYGLIAANILIFLSYQELSGSASELYRFYNLWALIPAQSSPHSYVSSMFLHAGWMHLGGNMLFLYIFGDNLEDEMGHGWFAAFYLTCGVLASAAHVASDPGSPVPLVGASGAIAGVMGGYLLLFPRAKVDVLFIFIIFFRIFAIPAWIMLGVWFGIQVFNGTSTVTAGGGVAHWAHAGGFVAGLILTLPLFFRLGGIRFWSKNHGHPPHAQVRYARSHIPPVRRRR
jgi:membrane associated rhomboid family serine protease